MKPRFWQVKGLSEMSRSEWESLCDGCGRCCLNKYEDDDTGDIHYTDVACRLLNTTSCRCRNYPGRRAEVPDCISLTPVNVPKMNCLPPTCAYRLVHEGKDLAWWHPLVSGRKATVHEAGISVRGRAVTETGLSEEEISRRLVKWPMTKRTRTAKPSL